MIPYARTMQHENAPQIMVTKTRVDRIEKALRDQSLAYIEQTYGLTAGELEKIKNFRVRMEAEHPGIWMELLDIFFNDLAETAHEVNLKQERLFQGAGI